MPDQNAWKERAGEWLASAREDLSLIQMSVSNQAISDSIYGFHAQQAVEKTLKAMLVGRRLKPPRTHDLRYLADQVQNSYRLRGDPLAGQDLTSWATVHRYPETKQQPDPLDRPAILTQVERSLKLAERLLR